MESDISGLYSCGKPPVLVKIEAPKIQSSYTGGRRSASSGVWLCFLLPLACFPSFSSIHIQCAPHSYILSILALQAGISSLYILRHISDVQGEVSLPKKIKESLSMRIIKVFLSHSFFPVLVTSFFMTCITDLGWFAGCVCCITMYHFQHRLSHWILDNFPESFSVGESLLVGQAGAMSLSLSLMSVFSLHATQVDGRDIKVYKFIHVAVVTASGLGYTTWYLRNQIGLFRFCFLALIWGLVGTGVSSFLLSDWTPIWLTRWVLSPTRLALVGWWTNLSVIIVITALASQRINEIPQTVLRKSFHVLMVLIVVPGVILDPPLTLLAVTGALLLFLLLEMVRVTEIEPLSSILDSIFAVFLDEKDCGSLVLSHIYLLVGLGLPLWLYPCHFTFEGLPGGPTIPSKPRWGHPASSSALPLLAGVLSVGVGDAAASVGGTYFGKHFFPGTRKTFEGATCSVLAQLGLVALLSHLEALRLPSWYSLIGLTLAIAFTAVVEALTDQVDNIVLPLLLYIPLVKY